MVALKKFARSRFWYLYWWQDGRKVWHSTGTEDRAVAMAMAQEVALVRMKRASVDRLQAIIAHAQSVTEEKYGVTWPVGSVWALYEQQPKVRRGEARGEGRETQHAASLAGGVGGGETGGQEGGGGGGELGRGEVTTRCRKTEGGGRGETMLGSRGG